MKPAMCVIADKSSTSADTRCTGCKQGISLARFQKAHTWPLPDVLTCTLMPLTSMV